MPNETTPSEVTTEQGGQSENTPAGFSPIDSQKELDKIIGERLNRAEKKWMKDHQEIFDKAKSFDEIEEKNKSDLEKANDRATKAEQELAELKAIREHELLVSEVARSKGVDLELLSKMVGDTREEIEANADTLIEHFSAMPKFPDVNDNGGHGAPAVTKESILAIKNPNERFEAIKQNANLFRS